MIITADTEGPKGTAADEDAYMLRPHFKQKFRPHVVTSIIRRVLTERLTGAQYHPDTCSQGAREIADEIRNKLKELDLPRYKYVVNVVIGEVRGEGARMSCRCFWDADTDNIAQDLFMNDSLFCVAAAFGVFYY